MRLKTLKELTSTLDAIDQLLSSLYKTDKQQFNEILENNQTLKEYLLSGNSSSESPNLSPQSPNVSELLNDLKGSLLKKERVRVSLGFEPGTPLIDEMYDKVSSFVGDSFVLDVEVRPELLGGLQIAYKGKFLDLSLRSKLENYFKGFKNINDLLNA
jgi:F0F1-type ATP synthase delta subunit